MLHVAGFENYLIFYRPLEIAIEIIPTFTPISVHL